MQDNTYRRISLRIPFQTFKRVEEARWIGRKTRTEVIVEALDEYCNRYGILLDEESQRSELEVGGRDPIEELSEMLNG